MGVQTDEKIIQYIRRKVKASTKIVAILGIEMLVDSGGYDLDSNDQNYRVEEEYGFSPEDMLTNSFFNSKPEKFYKFYKKEILGMKTHITPAFEALMRLDAQGKVGAVINQNYHGLPEGVSFKRYIELNGSIYENKCPRCGMNFDISYLTGAKDIPICDGCKIAVRPDIRLIGERVDTKIMTDVAVACEDADILMFFGKSIYNDKLEVQASPEREQLKILFTNDDFVENRLVDFIIRDDISTFLPLVLD